MPRWNNNLENNCIQVLVGVIKNLHPVTYQHLLEDIVSSSIENNKKEIEKYARSKLKLTSTIAKRTKQYWSLRGWPEDESYARAKENTRRNSKSVFSREFWIEKINPVTGINYTLDEADYERNSRRPIRKEYWIKQGYSENEAENLAIEAKLKNNKKGARSSASSSVRKVTSKRCTEYYTARGYTEDKAKELVSTGQRYFSKEICIEKYGEVEGLKIWQSRQARWQETLNSKSTVEKARINKLKLFKNGAISKGELKLFEEIRIEVPGCKNQHAILKEDRTSYYVYDISYQDKIIEYNGDYWHASPKKYNASDLVKLPNKTLVAKDIWAKDEQKINFAISQGYEVLVIWESDFKQNKEKVIKECIQFLTQ